MTIEKLMGMTNDAIKLIICEDSKDKNVCYKKLGYYASIKDLIEKQIPKKVIVNKDGCRNCPNCYTNESWICFEQDINEPFEYCANCGQKLDWSDYDE